MSKRRLLLLLRKMKYGGCVALCAMLSPLKSAGDSTTDVLRSLHQTALLMTDLLAQNQGRRVLHTCGTTCALVRCDPDAGSSLLLRTLAGTHSRCATCEHTVGHSHTEPITVCESANANILEQAGEDRSV